MKNRRNMKIKIILLSFALILIVVGGTTYAYLNASTPSVSNQFEGTQINVGVIEKDKVHEDSTNNIEFYNRLTKANQTVDKVVSVKNMAGNSYVRVRLVPIIKDNQGQTIAKNVGIKYTFESNSDWKTDGNGTYYYTKELQSEEVTDVLLKSVTLKEDLANGEILELQVFSDAIAARPVSNLQEAWGIVNFSGMQPLS